MYCRNCGFPLPENSAFCSECGVGQTINPAGDIQAHATGHQSGAATSNGHLQQTSRQSIQTSRQYEQVSQQFVKKTKKGHGCVTAFFVTAGLATVAAIAAYIFVPGLIRPYDFGVKSSHASYENAIQKLGIAKDEAPLAKSADAVKIVYGSPHETNTEFTSEEITSFFNENRPAYYAFQNVQIRINRDNTVDTAGTIDSSYVFNTVLQGRYTREDVKKALPMLGLLPDKVNFSCNVDGAIRNNKTESLHINNISVMGIPIPSSILDTQKASGFASSTLNDYLGSIALKSGASYDLIQVESGKLKFRGSLPSSIRHEAMEQ